MAIKDKAELKGDLATIYPDNSEGLITPALLRGQQTDVIDSLALLNAGNVLGWGFYVDGDGDQIITSTPSVIAIDGLGVETNTTYLPSEIQGISELWTGDKITPISLGDSYTIRLDLEVTAEGANPLEIDIALDIGGGASPTIVIVDMLSKTGQGLPYTLSAGFPIFCLSTFMANGGQFFASTNTGTVTLGSRQISIHRISKG